jgi:ABC-type multidrug transport system fused ATPase/permease subunit
MWSEIRDERGWVIVYMIMSSLAMAVALTYPLVIMKLLNEFQRLSGDELLHAVWVLLGLYFVSDVVFWLLHGPSRLIENRLSFKIKVRFQHKLFQMVTRLPMRWQRDHHSGETIDQVAKATTALGDFSSRCFEIIHLLTKFFGSIAVLSWFMPWAGVSVAVMTCVVVATVTLFDRVLTDQYRRLNKKYNEVAAAIQDYLTNVGTIISLRLENRVGKEVLERANRIFPLYQNNSRLNELKWFIASMLVTAIQVGVLLSYCVITLGAGETILAGTFYALYDYLRSIGEAFFHFTWKWSDLVVQNARVKAVDHIIEAYERDVLGSESARLPTNWRSLEIHDLEFSHADAAQKREGDKSLPHVRGVSFRLERGKAYAFVGESGSGKSTVLGLLRGLHPADRAEVVCDGVVLPQGLTHVSHSATLIPQEPEIFSETIRFNVTMGCETDPSEVDKAVKAAQFEAVLKRLPRGLDTSIAEKGVNLSGGEKQRLALARGFFFVEESESDLLLLDEPTSSVDLVNERQIYQRLISTNRHRCVVSALHKFHLLPLFDEVVVFVGGSVVERGTAADLLANNGEFRRLWGSYASESELAA